jgi:hypothetical protein
MQICLQLFATMYGGEYGTVGIGTISEGDELYGYIISIGSTGKIV